jgi:hypothetical protein
VHTVRQLQKGFEPPGHPAGGAVAEEREERDGQGAVEPRQGVVEPFVGTGGCVRGERVLDPRRPTLLLKRGEKARLRGRGALEALKQDAAVAEFAAVPVGDR